MNEFTAIIDKCVVEQTELRQEFYHDPLLPSETLTPHRLQNGKIIYTAFDYLHLTNKRYV